MDFFLRDILKLLLQLGCESGFLLLVVFGLAVYLDWHCLLEWTVEEEKLGCVAC